MLTSFVTFFLLKDGGRIWHWLLLPPITAALSRAVPELLKSADGPSGSPGPP